MVLVEKKANLRIAITTGDQDGIGPEVTAKALYTLGPKKGVHFFLWRSAKVPKKLLKLIDKKFSRITYNNWNDAKAHQPSYKEIIDIVSSEAPPSWIEQMTYAGKNNEIDALVTGPLSKTLIRESGMKDIGHTDIFSRICKTKHLFMAFLGEKFNVLVATGHIPLRTIPKELHADRLTTALRAAHALKHGLAKTSKPIALLGLNPHAGEDGLIGSEEEKIHIPIISKLKTQNIPIAGPLVPDAAFLKANWKKYPVFVCNYHDQGLIPFKTVHQHQSGCHLTMGLPFIRTSVEHGTAKELFDKGKANENSMLDAIIWAIKLGKISFKPDNF